MINCKSLKWCSGIILSLGLSACMDMPRSEQMEGQRHEQMNAQYKQHHERHATGQKAKGQQKTYASKDPTQKATPGPARKSAPQLPVIQ